MSAAASGRTIALRYSSRVEEALARIERELEGAYRFSHRAMAVLLLQGDLDADEAVARAEGARYARIAEVVRAVREECGPECEELLGTARREAASQLVATHVEGPTTARLSFQERLSRICTSPVTGVPVLIFVLWAGLYQFVGVFGGGTLVGLLEDGLFGQIINPAVTAWVQAVSPWPWLSSLLVGDYGVWTLGITYSVALIFPIVGTFFLAFSALEDSGYFPRLALLVDRLFKAIGLSGKAVIPIVLGFGCDTMATMVTRILETRRERLIATFLLSLAIPCSAQIGVMTALLHDHPAAFWIWGGVVAGILLLIGYLTSRLLPGEPSRFAMEMPPLRLPRLGNILSKTVARMQWYLMEVLPLFVAASVVLWLGQLTGVLHWALAGLVPVVGLLGLPDAAAEAFLLGFFRRDYGAAGLYRLEEVGALTGNQLLVAVVTLTIFVPCVAQLLMTKKERGTRAAISMAAFIFPFAILTGAVLNWTLHALGVSL
ncbi:MAG TPA: ferrous iron transporter B [Chthonomonadales bacterium]|nr:ferrous iron transporter B [Chthonomonadales bacterium]